jgi:hypothetical protein
MEMKKGIVKKALLYRSHVLGWVFFGLVVATFLLELFFFTSYNYEIVNGAYRIDIRARFLSLIVEKQTEIIRIQEEYIKTLKADNRALEIRKETLEAENATLQGEIVHSVGPMLERLGYRIIIIGSKIYCEKNGND